MLQKKQLTIYKELFFASTIFFFLFILFFNKIFQGYYLADDQELPRYYPFKPLINKQIKDPYRNMSDSITEDLPLKYTTNYIINNGELPLWNPYSMAGRPFQANPRTQLFYPPNMFFYFFNPPLVATLSAMAHLFLAGLFTFLSLRFYFHFSLLASFLGSLIYMFNNQVLHNLYFNSDIATLTFLPVSFFFLTNFIKKQNRPNFLLLTLSNTLLILAGNTEYVIFTTAFNFIFLLLSKINQKIIRGFLISLVFSILISTVQIIPLIEASRISNRSVGLLREISLHPILTLKALIQTIHTEQSLPFIGRLPFLFLLFSFIFIKTKKIQVVQKILIFTLLLMFVSPHLYFILIKFPLLGGMRSFYRAIIIYVFSSTILTAAFFDKLTRKGSIFFIKKILFATIIITLSFAAFFKLYFLAQNFPFFNYIRLFTSIKNRVGPTKLMIDTTIVYWLVFIFLLFLMKYTTKRKWPRFFLIIIIMVLSEFYLLSLNILKFIPKKELYPPIPAFEFLKRDKTIYRVAGLEDVLPFETFTPYKLSALSGLTTIYPLTYRDFVTAINNNGQPERLLGFSVGWFKNFDSPIFDLMNVKYILASPSSNLKINKLKLVYDKEIKIYENKEVLPRAFFIHNYLIEKNQEKAFSYLFDKNYNPKKLAILDKQPNDTIEETKKTNGGKINILNYQANKVELNVKTTRDSLLVLSDNYYPGWQAFVDEEPTEILKANTTLRAVSVPKGEHKIEFVFRPNSFYLGLIISLLTVILLVLFCLVKIFHRSLQNLPDHI